MKFFIWDFENEYVVVDLDKIIKGEKINLEVKVYTLGHRNPQGLTKIQESFFSVEHGPMGGDELNKIKKIKIMDGQKFLMELNIYMMKKEKLMR